MNHNIIEIPTKDVIIKRSVRANYGDLKSLISSIRRIGMIYPIIVDKNNILISGNRRVEACLEAGIDNIPAIKLDLDYDSPDALEIQADDNLCRLPFAAEDFDKIIELKKLSISDSNKKNIVHGIMNVFSHSADS